MASPFEVSAAQIAGLGPAQLVELLRRLLHAEARSNGLARSGVIVPAQINVPDKGEDAQIQWSAGPERTDYLPKRRTMFQSKASKMIPSACEKEVTGSDGNLKPAIQEVLEASGAYIIFSTQSCTGPMIRGRLASIEKGIAESGSGPYPSAVVDFYDSNRIADWCNSHPAAGAWALEQVTGLTPAIFQTWDRWSGNQDVSQYSFVDSLGAEAHRRQLSAHLASPRAVARIVALSGIGKTRLALETFRPPADPADTIQAASSDSVIYADASFVEAALVEQVSALQRDGLEATLVVDNCRAELHLRLAAAVTNTESRLSLLSLDYEPSGTAGVEHLIQLEPASKEVVQGILRQAYPELDDTEASRIADFAQGFPQIAVLLGDAREGPELRLGPLNDESLVNRMLWGRSAEDPDARDVIRACSLFTMVGCDGRVKGQLEFVSHSLCGMDPARFFSIVQDFKERGIIQGRGDFIRVQPRPLALRLAAERWKRTQPDAAKRIFESEMPPGMVESLCDQLGHLDFLQEAREIISSLCEPTGPFGRAEALNTAVGARCFRPLVETNPDAAISALERSFGNWDTARLLDVGPGRRDIVWALEKLAFRQHFFVRAGRLLLAFAAAENESWSNNATGEFVSKFQLYLSGTEAGPDLKFALIDEALGSTDSRRVEITVDALARALEVDHFSRSGGAESQGTGPPLQDWRPQTHGDVRDYLRAALDRLRNLAQATSEHSEKAAAEIAHHARGLISAGLVDEVSAALVEIRATRGSYWPAALESVGHSLEYDGEDMPEGYKQKVTALFDSLQPSGLIERIRFVVRDLPWGMFVDREGDERRRILEARELAHEVAEDPSKLLDQVEELLRGEVRQAAEFGRELGKVFPEPDRLIERSIDLLRGMPNDEANPTMLSAFLGSLRDRLPDLVSSTLDRVAATGASSAPDVVDLSLFLRIGDDDLARIVRALETGGVSSRSAMRLAYGSVLAHLPPSSLAPLVDFLVGEGGESLWVALEILEMYGHGDRSRLKELRGRMLEVISTPGLLSMPRPGRIASHHFQEAAKFLLTSRPEDELARHLAQEFVRSASDRARTGSDDHAWEEILTVLLDRYRGVAWPVISSALETGEYWRFERFLGDRFAGHRGAPGVIEGLPEDFLIEWCHSAPALGPQFLVRCVRLVRKEDDSTSWTPLIRRLVDEFSEQEGFLDALSSAMGTYSWTGSLVPYYEQYVEPLRALLDHPSAAVRGWTQDRLDDTQRMVERERRRDQERDLGIY